MVVGRDAALRARVRLPRGCGVLLPQGRIAKQRAAARPASYAINRAH
jgi:hypothetical protein